MHLYIPDKNKLHHYLSGDKPSNIDLNSSQVKFDQKKWCTNMASFIPTGKIDSIFNCPCLLL